MHIGGKDHIIESSKQGRLKIAIAIIRKHWQEAESYNSERPEDVKEVIGDEPGLREVFVYRDSLATFSWGFRGAAPSNESDLIHLLDEDNRITIVTGTRGRQDVLDIMADLTKELS